MAKKQEFKKRYGRTLKTDAERLSDKDVKRLRETCRKTPEQFRETVRNAVETQMKETGELQSAEEMQRQETGGLQSAEEMQRQETGELKNAAKVQAREAGELQDAAEMHRKEAGKLQYGNGRMEAKQLEDPGKSAERNGAKKRKRFSRVWLLAAAAVAVCGVAAASGSPWLKAHLLGRGLTESEAEVLLETELQQSVTECGDTALPQGAERADADWQEPVLTVEEAYFDGSSLFFLAEPSKEAAEYEIYLKDHASVNGYDGMTTMQTIDDGRYLGQIALAEAGAAEKILQAETVQVTMTVMTVVRPEEFRGRTMYTWKDAQAYEALFGTGAFESEYGPCLVISAKDAVGTVYTPQELTVDVPLTENAKQTIEQCRAEGRLEESPAALTEHGENAANAGDEAASGEIQTAWGPLETEDADNRTEQAADGTAQSDEIEAAAQAQISVKKEEDRVACEVPTSSGTLGVDAQIAQRTDAVYTGVLRSEAASEDVLKSLYEAGDPQQWESVSEEGANAEEILLTQKWQYSGKFIFASSSVELTHYENDEEKDAEALTSEDVGADAGMLQETAGNGASTEAASGVQDAERFDACRRVLDKLGLEGIITENPMSTDMTQKYYNVQLLLEDLPVAWYSQWNSKCGIDLLDGEVVGVNAPGKWTVLEKEEAALLDMEEVLAHVAGYVASGEIEAPASGAAIDEISLEYYVDLTNQGLIFRPVWNFKLPYVLSPDDAGMLWAENYFYVDAVTGALIRDGAGY